MVEGISGSAPPRGGTDLSRTVERVKAVARPEQRPEARTEAARAEAPEPAATAPVDAIALVEAREAIAAVLAEANSADAAKTATPIPLAPGADGDAVAAARALAQLIVANARPALASQARVGAAVVRTVLGD